MGGQQGAIRHQIMQQLSRAGFIDVHVMPESFLVRAKDPRGNPVMMIINPDSGTAVTAMGGQASGQMAQGAGPGGSRATGSSTMARSEQFGNAAGAPNGQAATAR